jgi:hypothetical protein
MATRTNKEIFEQEAYYYYNDGIKALEQGDTKEANFCFEMAESYLKDAGVKYTGKGKTLSWGE